MKSTVLYALYSEKVSGYMGVDVTAELFEDSPAVEYSLSKFFEDEQLWTTTNKETAQRVVDTPDVSWYNTSYNRPKWNKKIYGELTIKEIPLP